MYSRFLKFVVLFFVSTFSICSSVAASIFYDFSKIDGFDKWDTSYKERVVEYDEGIVTFNRANHQSNKQPINTIPVVNRKNNSDNNDITFVLKGKGTINSLSLTCRQWNTYELKVLLFTSTDGGATYSDTKISTTINGKDSVLEAKDLVKVNAVKFAFSNNKYVGIASLSLDLSDDESVPSHAVSYYVNGELMQRDSIKEGDSFNLPEPTGVPQGVPFMGWTTTPLEGMQELPYS